MSSSPLYNCTGPFPPVSVNTDITGYGVVANYVATGGIAVLLITIYFLVGYEPARDPFRKTNQDPSNPSFRPNPIDLIILWALRYIPKRLRGTRQVYAGPYFERSFLKCILAMGDLQIITGISILISGFVQLHRGLSSYHWAIIVDLAWFSSLTHLACLTILRNYLHTHPLQRLWRVYSMAALLILLVVALSFTGNYGWAVSSPPSGSPGGYEVKLNEPAICYLGHLSRSGIAYWSMVCSILLIVIGFVVRIVKLFRTISINAVGRARDWISIRFRRLLRVPYNWCSTSSLKSLKRILCYRPLLAVFLMARVFLDGWSSMFLEVCWLIVGFVWGTIRLFSLLQLKVEEGTSNSDWGFGQVAAVVLLLAPLVTIVEYFDHGVKQSDGAETDFGRRPYDLLPFASTLPNMTAFPFRHDRPSDPDDPECDWNDHAETLGAVTIYGATTPFYIVTVGFFLTGLPLMSIWYTFKPILMTLIGLFEVVSFSLMIETLSWCRRLLHTLNVLFFVCGVLLLSLLPMTLEPYNPFNFAWPGSSFLIYFLISGAGLYILCAIAYRILG